MCASTTHGEVFDHDFGCKTRDHKLLLTRFAFSVPDLSFYVSLNSTNRELIDLIYKEYNESDEIFNIESISALFRGFILSLRGQCSPLKGKIFQSRDYENFKTFRQFVKDNYCKIRNEEDFSHLMKLSKKTINQVSRNVAG